MKTATFRGIASVLFLCLLLSGCDEDSRKLKIGENEISYATTVTRAEAVRIGNYLRDADWIEKGEGFALRVSKNKRDYELRWTVGRKLFVFPDTLGYFRRVADSLSANLKGNAVSIELVSPEDRSNWLVQKEPLPFVKVKEGMMYYGEMVKESESEQIAAILAGDSFFFGKRRLLFLDRYGEEYELKLALDESERNQFVYEEMASWANTINREVFPDARVSLTPCDPLLGPQDKVIEANLFKGSFETGNLTLFFSEEVDAPDATRLHDFIENCLKTNSSTCDHFHQIHRITLQKQGGKLEIALAGQGDFDNPGIEGTYQELSRQLSSKVFSGRAVRLRVYNPDTWEYKLFDS